MLLLPEIIHTTHALRVPLLSLPLRVSLLPLPLRVSLLSQSLPLARAQHRPRSYVLQMWRHRLHRIRAIIVLPRRSRALAHARWRRHGRTRARKDLLRVPASAHLAVTIWVLPRPRGLVDGRTQHTGLLLVLPLRDRVRNVVVVEVVVAEAVAAATIFGIVRVNISARTGTERTEHDLTRRTRCTRIAG